MDSVNLGKYLTLDAFCTCTQTYRQYGDRIDPFPENLAETIPALQDLNRWILDPIIDHFGLENFRLTYGFCSKDLIKFLEKKDPITGLKNGRVAPAIDQHMAYEKNQKGNYFCKRPGAACDFQISDQTSDRLIEWILKQKLPFDSLYFYGSDRPIHISYGSQHKRSIWTFTQGKQPTQKGIKSWVDQAKQF